MSNDNEIGLGAGGDRSWLRELDPDGNTDMTPEGMEENVVGCFTGTYSFFNVPNPQPGYEYQWCLNPSRPAGTYADAMHINHVLGGRIVRADEPEGIYLQKMEGMEAAPMDGAVSVRELVLVKIPEERVRQRRDEQNKQNLAQLRGRSEENFISGASAEEIQAGQGKPTRFRSYRHQTEFQEDGETREYHTPDAGIVRVDKTTPKNLK